MIIFKKAYKKLYLKFKSELEDLYITTFSKGISAQYISKQDADTYLNEIFKKGFGVFGFNEDQIIAALLVTPISFDSERPENIKLNYSDKNTVYIAEVLVDERFRGQGLGRKIMEKFDETLDNEIKYVILRVWTENKPAVSLYEKSGFQTIAQIIQQKLKPNQKDKFTMHKNYMLKSY